MSHFSTLKVCVKKIALAKKVAQDMGWTVEFVDKYDNPWRYAKESVSEVNLFKNASGKVMMAVDSKGNVIHDSFSMGNDAFKFLRNYSEEFIRKTAAADGAMVVCKGEDSSGNRILEIEYAY